MPTKNELESQVDYLTAELARVTQLYETELAKKSKPDINPDYLRLAKRLSEGAISVADLADLFERDSRTISQWLFQLKKQHGAKIITTGNGRKALEEPLFGFPASAILVGSQDASIADLSNSSEI